MYYSKQEIPSLQLIENGGTYTLPQGSIIMFHTNPHCLGISTSRLTSYVNENGIEQMEMSSSEHYANRVYGVPESTPDVKETIAYFTTFLCLFTLLYCQYMLK